MEKKKPGPKRATEPSVYVVTEPNERPYYVAYRNKAVRLCEKIEGASFTTVPFKD